MGPALVPAWSDGRDVHGCRSCTALVIARPHAIDGYSAMGYWAADPC